MKAVITPSTAYGSITAPPSKSMAHRMIMCAALAGIHAPDKDALQSYYNADAKQFICNGSLLSNVEMSEDIRASAACSETLNSLIKEIRAEDADQDPGKKYEFNCGESGSTLRFFIPAALLFGRETFFRGSSYLLQRPLGVYEDICRKCGLVFERNDYFIRVKGPLRPGDFCVPGDISSQFISGLLFALPLLNGMSRIIISGKIESRPYIDMTIKTMRDFGVTASWEDSHTLSVPGGQAYRPGKYTVEGDYSNAAFLEAFNLIGGNVDVKGLREDSPQGDRVFREYFKKLQEKDAVPDISDCPDLGPVLIALSALLHGCTLTGTGRLRIKESDRGNAMREELAKLGIDIEVGNNSVIIPDRELRAPERELDTHNDHRIAMALAIILTKTGGVINNAEAVNKSFPGFFDTLKKLHIDVTLG